MREESQFIAPWASPPGETINDLLEDRGLSPADFAALIGQSTEDFNQILLGKVVITTAVAKALASNLGPSAEFWLRREASYRASLDRRAAAESRESKAAWLRSLPLRDMIDFGWVEADSVSTEEAAKKCLDYFGEPDLSSWRSAYRTAIEMTAFRKSPKFESDLAAVSAWLRQGEIEAEMVDCDPWNPMRFKEAIALIRPLTRCKDPNVFLPSLRNICAKAGVAVAIVRAPAGCRASGATLFPSSEKALLMLSFRYLSDDHFWFTFFHEAGHLLLHSDDDLFLEEINGEPSEKENEANAFAAATLIPPELQAEMLNLRIDAHNIVRFARRAGVSPGIIVGQLQHRGRISHGRLNSLKRRFSWGEA